MTLFSNEEDKPNLCKFRTEFALATEVTTLAKELNPTRYENVERVFVCPDVNNIWLIRVIPNTNEDYEYEEGMYIVERNDIDYVNKAESDTKNITQTHLETILKEDEGDNWDSESFLSADDAYQAVDGGWGVIDEDGARTAIL